MNLSNKNVVEKSNELNTIRNYNPVQEMTLIEYRFFCLYLSKLNARNLESRTMMISVKEFEKLFEVSLHTTHFNDAIEKIMSRKLKIRNKNGKISIINLYSKFEWLDDSSCKEIEVTCNYDIVPYLFELKNNYTSYKIVNIVNLNSVSKIRLYEICKQYEKIGKIKLEVKELQEMLCCKINEFRDFTQKILKPAIKDINEYTDIQISYEKVLSCRKVVALTFTIQNKKDLPICVETVEKPVESSFSNAIQSLYYKCDEAYTMEQLEMISNYINNSGVKLNVSTENYIYSVYANIKIKGNKVNNLFRYTFSVIEKQINDYIFAPNLQQEKEKPQKRESSYNIDGFKDKIHTTKHYLGEEDKEEKDDFDEIINSGVIPFD